MSQQNVYIDISSIQSGEGVTELTVVYDATDSEVSGLGLRIHYDSSQLSVNGISNVLQSDLVFAYDTPSADSEDFDNDITTDQYIDLGWASLYGDWPGFAPINLVTISFDNASLDETIINFTASSHAVGYEFVGQSAQLSAEETPPVFTSPDTASIDENIGDSQVVYTAASDASSEVVYSLVDNTVYSTDSTETTAPELVADTQMISISDIPSAQAGEQLSLTVNYNADDNQLPGLGLRIHFDSSLLTVADITNIFAHDQIFVDSDAQSDADDYDANTATDSFVTVAWASVNGDWPGEELPSNLLTVLFDVSADASGTAAVGFSAIDTAIGYDFSAPSYDIAITSSPLSIDAATGEVTLIDNPDFESLESYNFTVTATDAAGNAVDQAVTLTVNNLDEVAPVITSADSAVIDEDTGAGQVIYTATADDSADTSDGVSYSLVDNTVYTVTETSADAPADTQLISVASYSAPDANGQIAVTVNYNADDNQLSGLGLRIHYDSSMLSVADVTDVLAQDLIYTDSAAEVDSDDLDANASTDAYVTVGWASVGGDWPNTDLPNELLTILFDVAADASGSTAIGFSSTSTPVGYDFSGNGYALEIIESPLSIDSATGEVTLSENPDYDVRDTYNFTVTATDAAGNASAPQAVTVSVNEAPDLPPVFTSPDTVSVDENSGSQQVVYTAASDASSEVVYSLVDNTVYPNSQQNVSQAELLANTSMISASGDSSAETGEQVSLAINYNADDNQLPGLGLRIHYDSSKLAVAGVSNVLGQDLIYTDTAPQADSADYDADPSTDAYITVGWASLGGDWPNTDLPSQLLNILFDVAEDASGDASVGFSSTSTPVGYEFAGEGYEIEIVTSPLEINSATGEVTLIDNPDFESLESYNFTVTATDAAGNAVDQAVTLTVNNLDEVAPVITSADSAVIDEDTGAGQVIYTATADDSADTSDGVSYSLVDNTVYTVTETSADAPADTQLISVASYSAPDANGQIAVTVNYNADDNQLSGLGLRIHYDSSMLSVADVTDVLAQDLIYTDSAAEVDSDDLDANASTDAYVTVGWASVGGDWPNTDLPNELLTILFDVAADASGSTAIGFSSTSTPVGYDFSGNGYALEIIESPLSIDSATGEVTLSENPDYDVRDTYNFTVTATDAAGNASAPQAVTVSVNEVDDIPPVITSGDTNAIDENSGANQVIYTATADDTDASYSLSEDSDTALSIDSVTGEVTLAANPDYEAQSQYSFSVIATDAAGNASEAQAVTLDINNLDEVAPVITSGDAATAVDENSAAGQVVYTVTANDSADISDGVTYSLVDDTDYTNTNTNTQQLSDGLQMVSVSGSPVAFGGEQVEISVAYNADDNQLPGLGLRIHFDSTKLSVAQVKDVLDQDLIFVDSDTQADADDYDADSGTDSFVTVAWASMNGNWPNEALPSDLLTLVFDVASDTTGDASIGFSAISTAVGYELSATGYDLEIVNSPLTIDSATGEVTLVESPDFEAQDSYNFTVIATDAAGNVSDSQSVSLDINNLDEVAPAITSDATAIAIDENSGAGQVVYTATAEDSLDISNGVTFSLAVGSDSAFEIDAETGAVTLTANPDYEAQSQYSFAVVATDTAGNVSDAQSVTLDINNLDEVAPTITSSDTANAIDENSGAGQVIYTATAEDSADISDGFSYSLSEDSDSALSIDSVTGEVTLTTDPDHETQSQYNFAVMATDAAGNVSDAQSVTLNINDLDDAAPTITSDATATAIDENSGAGQVIYTATADDSVDDVSDTPITFSLSEYSDSAVSINSETGEVTLNTDPDHETQSQYSFAVIATDAAGNVSDAQSVTLDINDLDDAAPTIISGDTAVAINENSGAGQVIYTATSNDSADNISDTPISYSLAEGSDPAVSINTETGEVTLADNPDAETQAQYSFAVIATDAAGNVSDAQSVTLDINDLDDAAPTITSGATAVAIDENSGAGQVIYTATADDSADDIADTPIIYSLAEGSDPAVSINSSTGAVTLNANPDHETQSQYSFAVIATDNAGNVSEAQSVTLDINDLDDAAPTITSGATAVAIDENSGAGQVIYTATADDSADDVADTPITYSLAEGSDAALSIDAETGAVTLSTDPNFEAQSQYSFAVIATDAAGNASNAQSVTLDINNLDEVAPTITSGDSAAVLESSGANALVYRALADDTDDISAGVTFSLSEDSDTALSIDAITGEVILTDEPDFAVKPSYSFTVIADDGVNQSQKAVTLTVVDEDLEAPVFTSSTSVAIDENIGENQVIYTAITDDESLVNYSLSEGSDAALSIDSATGAVTLATDPDHETQSEYSFTVIATDIANNVSEQAVTVSINDLDDAAPTITSVDTAASIDENSGSGQVIYTVTADDSGDDVTATPITYSLTEDSDAGLSINASTGAVSLTADPDHESQSEYSFAVIATDAAGNSSEAQSVTLNINDLDDTAPEIISGETAAAVDENSGANQVIYTATADDSVDVTDGVTFRLSEDSDVALSIDSATGAVTLATNPDHETQSQYSFSVIATDAAGNESAPQAVTLEINDLDDADPVITSSDTATALDENSGAAQVIYTATADDSADISGGVTFSLSEDSDAALSIDSATGAVTLSDDPDAETQSQYTFTVVATDAAGNSSEQAVALNINNLDEVAPTITSGDTAAAVDENSGSDQVVYTAAADDSADVSGGVTFSLSEDSDAALSIDSLTGAVTLATDPDAETQSQYTFTVVATDAAGNSSDQAVTLNINNLDEVAPTITSGDTADAIFENSGAGQVIYTATADDSADISGGVTFSLSEDSDAALSIDSVTGEVTLATDPVFYYQNEYEFSVLSVDAAGNISSLQPVTLQINEIIPPEASVSLETDTGVSADNISSVVKILVSNIKLGATWEYSLDGGITWAAGDNGAPRADDNKVLSFDIDVDGSYEVNVRQTNTAGTTAMSESVPFTLDTLPPIVEFVSADSEAGTISVNYNESLDPAFSPNASDYDITQNGNPLTINDLSVIDNVLVLSITESFNPGALNFTYSASTDANEQVTDLAGNKLDQGFTQMIVSDGYIRGAQVYIDVNGDGIADEDELREEVTSDAFGQIILSDEFLNAPENIDENGNPYSVIVKGGVNMDSGAPNEIELTAPAGYSVINPLSTLVSEIASSDEFSGLTPEEAAVAAETSLAVSLGIEVGEGGLGSYDPQSDDNVANRVVATQIATVLAVASSTESTGSEGAETAALSSLASTITSAEGTVTLDSSTISSVLSDVIEDADALDKISTAVDEMEAVKASDDVESAFAAIVQAQAKAIDSIAPEAPESSLSPQSDTGVLGDEMTKQDSPTVRVSFETQLLDGTAAVAGDKLEIYSNGVVNGSYVLTEEDISLGYKDHEISVLADGEHYISAKLTDIAGNQSYVTTNILEVDTVKPEITSADSAANIDENSGADQVIYTATADNLSYANGQVTFSLSEDSDVALSIDSTTGAVTLSDDPDFEVQSQYTFSVIATDAAGNASDAQLVTLDINNLDDTAPEITSGATATAIDENSGAGQVIYTATADDSADISGGVTFSLEDEGLGFSIDSNSGVVTTNADFAADYEDAQSQSFTVVATDAAGNASEAQLVTLDINNLDEVAPIITSEDTAIAIGENSGAGQVIYTATADDSADISGGVIFSLSEDSDAALSIDASTGEVTLATDPDFEGQSQYTFSVIATDAAGNASEAQLVSLDINNLDDTAPEITSGETATAIDENSGAGQVIYTATADDSADISGGVTFSLSEDSDAALLIDSTTGAVTLSDDPDFEGQSQYIFSVIATDAAGNASEAQLVTLDINNLDDTAPEITSGETAPAVNENSGAGQVVYTATVDDSADVSDGFTFSLADEDLGFSIDAISGEVTTNADFAADFEDSQSQSFTVVATDAAGNVGEAQLVTLDINNLDEVAPIITSEDTAIAIGENSGAGQVIYTATADDSADISGGVIFSLSQDSDAALSIDASTGEVTLATDPDFEGQSQYTFSVIATDAAGNASEPKTVTLDINPIDDTSPVITSDLDVSLFDSSNSVIYQVTASDIDSPDETIAYSFSPQSVYQDPTLPAGAFDQVYSVNSDGSYTMQIIINEANLANYSAGLGNFGFNLNYSELEVSINGFGIPNGFTALANPIGPGVIDIGAYYADAFSVFDISAVNGLVAEINFDLKEDVYSAQFEITNAELNEDLVANDSVSRYLGNDGLSFNEATGEVSLPNAPDALAQPVYSFTITATDAAGNSTSELVTVLIDGAPVITSTNQPDGIDENSGSGQVVYTAISNKPDVTTFTLSEDSDDGLSIDASTGEVTLAADPDYEAQQEYSFTVIATDDEDRSSSKVVTVAVNNLDEVAATFSEPTVTQTIDENIGVGQVVFTASADDSSDVSNGVTYSLNDVRLDGEVTSDLSINAATGEVTLASNPDHESGEQYTFIVGASDGINTPVALQTVTLDVNDLDDAAPTITSGATATAIDENSGAGQVIYTATADDSADDVSDTPITFSLSEDSDAALSIDSVKGEVTLSTDPDYETQSQYSFAVIATDAAGNASEAQSVTLDINNLDEVAPTITSGDTASAIDENSGANQIVYTATADDSADISDGLTFSFVDTTVYSGSDAGSESDASSNAGSVESAISIPELAAATQHVYVSSSTKSEDGTQETIVISYNADDTTTTGLGLRIHFDSSVLSASDITALTGTDLLVNGVVESDGGDLDGDASTDQYISFGWASLFGQWPGSAPADLASITFDIAEGATGSSAINFTASSNAAGFAFDGQNHELAIGGDIDSDIAAPVESQLSFDSATGEVTLNVDPNYEAQSEYSFEVIATDAAGNASDAQSVTLDINNLDEVAPAITSEAETAVVDSGETNPVIYTVTADDSADISGGVTFDIEDTTEYAGAGFAPAESTVSIPDLVATTQHVYVSSSTKSGDGTQETVVVSYNADDTTTTGLGLRIHFDSTQLSVASLEGVFATDNIFSSADARSDDDDGDNDSTTDKYIEITWASLFGSWPGEVPVDLATITFDIAEGATGSSTINIEKSSNAAGFAFDGQSHQIAITGEEITVESQLSIDSATGEVTLSGELDPATQSEYSFTVTATDTAGNSSDLDVVVEAEQPMVDPMVALVVNGDTPSAPIYQASANIEGVSYQITDLTQYPNTDESSGSAESQISIPDLAATTQHVYVSSSTKSGDGTQETVVVSYNADDTTTTGLGLNVHFDSSVLSASDIAALMVTDLLVNGVVESDDDDLDGDASTDQYISFGWASLFGQWPGSVPADLASITFDIAEGATGSSAINLTASSNAAGFAFDGQSHNLVLAAAEVIPAAELVIDNAAGTVSLDGEANSDVMPAYSFTVDGTDADGDAIGSQTVPVVVVDQVVSADAASYTGTADADVFALADGSAEITSDAGADVFAFIPTMDSAIHTITDFESGEDSIDISAALVAAGYTADNAPTQLASADMSADILDLVNGDDSSLDNLFGATYDEDSNTLTVFADTNSTADVTDMDSFQVTLDENATVEDDDIVANLSAFIA